MQQLGPAWKALCWTLESGFLCSLFSQLAFGKPQKIKKPKGNKDAGSRICTSRTAGETSPPCRAECCSLGMKMSTVVLGLFVCLDSTPVKWLCDCLPLLSCRNLFLSPCRCPLCKINHSRESEALLFSWEPPPTTGGDVWEAARSQRRCLQQEEA